MKASGKIGSSGVWVSDNVEQRFETDIHTYIHTYIHISLSHFYYPNSGQIWLVAALLRVGGPRRQS